MLALSLRSAIAQSLFVVAQAQTYKASFTEYGSGDQNASGNCNVATTACGFFTNPGFSVAVSQNLFGVGPGAGAGPACGTCYQLTIETDTTGKQVATAGKSIVVKVTNLCPISGNPPCSQQTLTDTNPWGANVNFDLCINSGASGLFDGAGTQAAMGNATLVDCSQWTGTNVGTVPNVAGSSSAASSAPAVASTSSAAPAPPASSTSAPSPSAYVVSTSSIMTTSTILATTTKSTSLGSTVTEEAESSAAANAASSASSETVTIAVASGAAAGSTITEAVASGVAGGSTITEAVASGVAGGSTITEAVASGVAGGSTITEAVASGVATGGTVTEAVASGAASGSTVTISAGAISNPSAAASGGESGQLLSPPFPGNSTATLAGISAASFNSTGSSPALFTGSATRVDSVRHSGFVAAALALLVGAL